jgi:phosphopantetheine adenylyltransferase
VGLSIYLGSRTIEGIDKERELEVYRDSLARVNESIFLEIDRKDSIIESTLVRVDSLRKKIGIVDTSIIIMSNKFDEEIVIINSANGDSTVRILSDFLSEDD